MRHCMHEAETEVTRKNGESDPSALQGLTDT